MTHSTAFHRPCINLGNCKFTSGKICVSEACKLLRCKPSVLLFQCKSKERKCAGRLEKKGRGSSMCHHCQIYPSCCLPIPFRLLPAQFHLLPHSTSPTPTFPIFTHREGTSDSQKADKNQDWSHFSEFWKKKLTLENEKLKKTFGNKKVLWEVESISHS